MTDADINQLRDLLRAATPGPWKYVSAAGGHEHYVYAPDARYGPQYGNSPVKVAWLPWDPSNDRPVRDATLIVAAVNALPSLLDEVERLRANLKETTEHALQWADIAGAHGAEVDVLRKKVGRLRAMLSAAGCMMPTASGFIQLDTNDRIALDAAIDAAMGGEKRE